MIDINQIIRPNILTLNPYTSARDAHTGREGVFLDANENPYGTLNRYPDPYQRKLKQKLAILKGVAQENIFIGNGSDEVIDLAFRIFCNPGEDKVLTFSPTYGMYSVSAAINNIELINLPLANDFQINMDELSPYLNDSSIKLIFICSPNNPTGNLIYSADIELILNQFEGIVILDEAYIDFANRDSLIGLLQSHNNLIVMQTFSKAWGLAAARLGTAYSSEEIIAIYNRVKPPYNVSAINQQAAIDALDNIKNYKEKLALIKTEKERLITKLKTIHRIKTIYPSDANFLLIEVADANRFYKDLVAKKIIIRNRDKQITNCLRISIGTAEENEKLINALRTYA
jgi:histidinol-phosphate aminotransferase